MKKVMTSRERVLTALAHQEPDRVPMDYEANGAIDARLKRHFGLADHDADGLRAALGCDLHQVWIPYNGPQIHAPVPEVQVNPEWGIRTRWVEHPTGGYWDYCGFPLAEATLEQVEAWPMPNPDHYDYAAVRAQCERYPDLALYVGNPGLPDIINSTGMLFGMEQVLVGLISEDPAVLRFIERKAAIQLEVTRRTIEAARGRLDLLWMGEDLGTQIAPMISLDLYRRQIRPHQQKFVDLARAHRMPVVIHTCGCSSWAYEDFIVMGIRGVSTLQPEAVNMSPAHLKKTFGGRLAFHGCISTAGVLATGTPDEVTRTVRETLEIMKPGGGYILAPTHMIQDNSPTENVLAMYEAGRRFGGYG